MGRHPVGAVERNNGSSQSQGCLRLCSSRESLWEIWGGGSRCHGSASRLTQKFGFRETEKWEQLRDNEQNYISVQCWYSEPLSSADAGRSITSTDLISSVWCAEMIVHYSYCLWFGIQTHIIDWQDECVTWCSTDKSLAKRPWCL